MAPDPLILFSNVGLGEEERQQLFDFITELSSFEVRRLQLFEAIKASKLDLLLDPTDPTKKFFFDDIPGTVNEVRLGGPGDPTAKPVVTCGTGRFDCDDYVEAGVNFLNASKGEFGGVLENAVITAYQGSFFKQQSVIVEGQNQLPILEVKNFGDRKHAVVLITLGSGEHYAWNADDLYLSKATLTAEQAVEDAIWGAGRTLPRNPVTDVKPFIRPPVASGSPDAFSFQDDLGFRTLFTEAQLEQQQTPANIEKFFTRPAPSGE